MDFDKTLFDEYKRLDAICRDIFSSEQGVSEYIRQMEQTPSHKRHKVPMWDQDYRALKRLRWLRNKIAHETVATNCRPDDIVQLEDFYDRILHSEDPLASLRKIEQESQSRMSRSHTNVHKDVFCEDASFSNNCYEPEKHGRIISSLFVAIACASIVVFLSVIFIKVIV